MGVYILVRDLLVECFYGGVLDCVQREFCVGQLECSVGGDQFGGW